jgi:G:T-mismatch repair DNA endonuclease (very short patch repair protein)
LKAAGWDVMVVWECETKARDREKLTQRVSEFLSPAPIVDD